MLCGIGEKAGVHAVYWAYGVCFYDAEHKSTVRIHSELPGPRTGDVSGRVVIEAAGSSASSLVHHLVASVERLKVGRSPQVTWELGQPGLIAVAESKTDDKAETAFGEIRPEQPPPVAGEPQPVYVSYAWGGESEALVDQFERRLPKSLKLTRDKRTLRPGDWLSTFMMEIGRAESVLVVLSEKYLRSVYCMRELLYLYNTSLGEREVFMGKLVPLTVGEVRFSRAIDRIEHIRYWKQQHDELEAALDTLHTAERGDADRAELLMIKDFQHRVSDLLAWVADTLMPQAAEAHSKGLDAAIDLLLRRVSSRAASRN